MEEYVIQASDVRNGKTNFSHMAYRYILSRILSLDLKPGDSLRVRDLAPKLGISPPPIERALERLAGEGLVEFRPGKGPFVSEPTVSEVLELYDVRLMFELHAVREGIGQVDEPFLAQMDELLGVHETACNALKENYCHSLHLALTKADSDVHFHLISLWPNRKVESWYSQASTHIKSFQLVRKSWFYREGTVEEHRAIYQALENRNVVAAIDAIRRHEMAARQSLLERARMAELAESTQPR
ncbi:MAG: GntR family transcriptional regulator [Chloroflexi bacterium]|nr:GntR family transcriptional regulator [Chloroflexota bacterium]